MVYEIQFTTEVDLPHHDMSGEKRLVADPRAQPVLSQSIGINDHRPLGYAHQYGIIFAVSGGHVIAHPHRTRIRLFTDFPQGI